MVPPLRRHDRVRDVAQRQTCSGRTGRRQDPNGRFLHENIPFRMIQNNFARPEPPSSLYSIARVDNIKLFAPFVLCYSGSKIRPAGTERPPVFLRFQADQMGIGVYASSVRPTATAPAANRMITPIFAFIHSTSFLFWMDEKVRAVFEPFCKEYESDPPIVAELLKISEFFQAQKNGGTRCGMPPLQCTL